MRKFLKNKLGLSLVELVVTITIMAILAAWLIPSLISSKHDSDIKMDKSAVESLQSAIHIASQDSDVYTQAKMLADVSSNNQVKVIYALNANGILECSTVSIKMGDMVLTSNDAAGKDLQTLKTEIVNRVNSTMDPVELKTADAKEKAYCFIITFPDVKFKTNIEYYASDLEDVRNHWEDLGPEEIPTTPDELPDYTEPTDPPPPPPPAKKPGGITKHPVAKTGLVYTGSPQELVVPGSGTGTLYYSTKNATEGFSSEIPTGINAGTYTVWYYAEGTSTHLQSDTFQLTVEIDKASYNVVPPSAQAPVFDGKSHTLISAGSSKYGKMNYKLDNGSWGQALPSATAIGTYKIYYYGTGDANHHPTSKDAYITATISPSKTATYAVSNKVYNNTTYTGVVGENIIITGTNTAKDAGIYTVQVKPQTNYTWADGSNKTLTLTWEIARAKGTCNAPSIKTLNYTGAAQELINPATSATGTVYYKVNSGAWSTSIPKATAAGSYTIYYKMDPTLNYTGIDETLVGTATIGKVNPTVTAPVAKTGLVYNASYQTLITAGSTNGGTLKYSLDNVTYSTSLPQGLNAGNYTVWFYVEGNANFNTTAKQSIKVTIAQINPTYIAPKAKTVFYNGSAQQLITAGSNTTAGKFGYKLSTDSTYQNAATAIKGTNAGTYTVNWNFTPNDSTNYRTVSGSFTVNIQANGLLFNPNGGTVTISTGYPNNTKVNTLPTPTKSGTTFQKWVYDTSSNHLTLDTQFKYTGKISIHLEAYMDVWDNATKTLISCTNSSGWNIECYASNNYQIKMNMWDGGANGYRTVLSNKQWKDLSPGWHSFDLVFDGTYGYLYIDGTLEGKTGAFTGKLTYPDADNNIIIGREADGAPKSVESGVPPFQGKIANVMINNSGTRITNTNCFIVPMSGVTTLVAEYKSAGSCTAPTVKNLTYNGNAQQLITPAKNATGTVYYKIGENGTWSTSVPTATNVGSYKIYYCMAPTDTHTEIKETLIGTSTISTATVSITAPIAKNLTYNGSAQTLVTAGATSGGTMKYSTSENGTYSTTIPTGTNAGNYTVWYYVDGGSNFTTTSKQSVPVTIKKVTPTVTAPKGSTLTYTGSAQKLVTAGSTNYGTMKYSTSQNGTYSTTIPTGTTAGSYTVWWFVEGNANVNSTAKQSITVTIQKRSATITAPTAITGLTYKGVPQVLINPGSSTTPGKFTYKLSTQSTYGDISTAVGTNAGTYTVNWTFRPTDYNTYYGQTGSLTVTIGAAPSGLIYKVEDGKTWARILYQDTTNNTNYFTTDDMYDCNQAGKFSYLSHLEEFRGSDGKFTFMLQYPDCALSGQKNVWKQSSNPLSQYNNGTGNDAAGFEPIHMDWTNHTRGYGNGLELNGSLCVLDGCVNSGDWWLAVGLINGPYTGGVASPPANSYAPGPWPDGAHIGYGASKVELWVCVENVYTPGSEVEFNYTGNIQTFTAPIAGYYTLEVWGAQGGNSLSNGTSYAMGGMGGYSYGDVYLEAGETVYIAVGGKGGNPTPGTDAIGGWNGGGNSAHDHSDDEVAGAGGGATSITKGTKRGDGQLKNYASYQSQVLIVAGGGGGGEWYTFTNAAGVGGGLTGGLGSGCKNMSAATQSSGYAFGQGGAGVWNSSWGANYAADGLAGGGGGWYGGYGATTHDSGASSGGATSAAGGGSAYIGGVINGNTIAGANYGNGKARITYKGAAKPSAPATSTTGQSFSYTGNVQSFTAPVSGYYKLEAWGASGYGDTTEGASSRGGFGGYASGIKYLEAGQTIYVIVGGQGQLSTAMNTGAGYNGGGHGGTSGGGGGGMTHFSTEKNYATASAWNPYGTILVAGGGGGADNSFDGAGIYSGDDGSGGHGGTIGTPAHQSGVVRNNDRYVATVTNGGGCGMGGTDVAGFKQGVGESATYTTDTGGGGGGWYGGYTTNHNNGGGGGGSCYIGDVLNGSTSTGINAGNGKAKITLLSNTNPYEVLVNTRYTYGYTGGAQSFTAPVAGYYKLEAYGARGGASVNNEDSSMLGYGGYTAGTVYLNKGQTIYIYVGQAGTYSTGSGETGGSYAPATFNGGGDGGSRMGTPGAHLGGSGGGATDFRLVGGAWNNATGLQSRILVAGGGGGQGCASSHNRGHGGGLVGVTTVNTGYYYGASSYGGTQTAGGSGNGQYTINGVTSGSHVGSGGFGYGANAVQCGAGGGGGWYGGGTTYTSGGGGGSSFAAGYFGCSTAYSGSQGGFKFSDVTMTQGVQNGNGAAYITYLG